MMVIRESSLVDFVVMERICHHEHKSAKGGRLIGSEIQDSGF
jgi:hypothetical protein